MKYDFDRVIDRRNTNCGKWDYLIPKYGTDDIVPFWIADMDFPVAQEVIDAVVERAKQGIYGYAVRSATFNDALVDFYRRHHQWEIEKSTILEAECGLVNAIKNIVEEFTQEGDEVLVQSPVYHAFYRPVESLKRVIVESPLRFDGENYTMDFDDLRAKISDRTKIMLFCSPHNPVGRVWNKDELTQLCDILHEHHILLFSDEIHMDLVHPGFKHIPVGTLDHPILNNTIIGISTSKTFNTSGSYMGSLVIPNPELKARLDNRMAINEDFATNLFGAVIVEASYRYGDEWLEQVKEYIQSNIRFAKDYLESNVPEIRLLPSQSTYFLWIDCRKLGLNREELKSLMVDKAKVGINYGYTFGSGGEGFIRLNAACPRAILQQGLERIASAVGSLK